MTEGATMTDRVLAEKAGYCVYFKPDGKLGNEEAWGHELAALGVKELADMIANVFCNAVIIRLMFWGVAEAELDDTVWYEGCTDLDYIAHIEDFGDGDYEQWDATQSRGSSPEYTMAALVMCLQGLGESLLIAEKADALAEVVRGGE